MRYVMKENILTLTDSFTIRDNDGNKVYRVKGKLLSIGDKLSFRDMDGTLEKNSTASLMVIFKTSLILLLLNVTSRVSLLYRFPLQVLHFT